MNQLTSVCPYNKNKTYNVSANGSDSFKITQKIKGIVQSETIESLHHTSEIVSIPSSELLQLSYWYDYHMTH